MRESTGRNARHLKLERRLLDLTGGFKPSDQPSMRQHGKSSRNDPTVQVARLATAYFESEPSAKREVCADERSWDDAKRSRAGSLDPCVGG